VKLLLDIGNTSINWAEYRDDRIISRGHFRHCEGMFNRMATAAWAQLAVPQRIIVSNVAGAELRRTLSAWTLGRWDLEPDYIQATEHACGVTNAYQVPSELGADRWAALVGAHHGSSAPLCIVDCGTAMTVDVLSQAGEHLGGLILPGNAMLADLLLRDTAGIRTVDKLPPVCLLAKGTGEAVNSGATYMAVAAIDRVVCDLVAGLGENLEVILTGGDAVQILPLLARPARHEPDLVLQGLAILSGEH